jgi:hypothetical protein
VRHNFVNDIGDYATYALLRALCASDGTIRLGVVWYLTEHQEPNNDGRKRAHLSRDGWDQLDPDLLAAMRKIEAENQGTGALNVRLIESSGILPARTRYFAEAVPGTSISARRRISERAAWFRRARQAVAECDLVFLDPDNGLAVRSVPLTSPLAGKYATVREVTELLETGAGVVLYQHGNRTPWTEQRERVGAQIAAAADRPITIRTVRFGAFGVRGFFCFATSQRLTNAINHGLALLGRRVDGWDKSAHLQIE